MTLTAAAPHDHFAATAPHHYFAATATHGPLTATSATSATTAPSGHLAAADPHDLLAATAHGFLSPTGIEIAFLLVGLVTLGAALITVTTRQLVHAALWLVVALGGIAVEYLLLTAEFIAWVQVLIYVGSVVVLLLFGLMLTKAPIGHSPDADSGNRWVALAVASAAACALVWVVVDAFRTTWFALDGPVGGSTRATGESLFRSWVLPFEALSVLLLAALVGAIVLSRKAKGERDQDEPRRQDRNRPRHPDNGRESDGSSPFARNARKSESEAGEATGATAASGSTGATGATEATGATRTAKTPTASGTPAPSGRPAPSSTPAPSGPPATSGTPAPSGPPATSGTPAPSGKDGTP